jgi:hypothetical protein
MTRLVSLPEWVFLCIVMMSCNISTAMHPSCPFATRMLRCIPYEGKVRLCQTQVIPRHPSPARRHVECCADHPLCLGNTAGAFEQSTSSAKTLSILLGPNGATARTSFTQPPWKALEAHTKEQPCLSVSRTEVASVAASDKAHGGEQDSLVKPYIQKHHTEPLTHSPSRSRLMDHSRRATSSRGQATSGSSSRSVLSDSEARALQLWLDRGHKLARSIDVEEKHRANLGLSVWSYTPDTLNGLRTICRAIATKSDHLSKHADVTEREITVAAQELLKRSRAEDPRDMYLSDYMDFHKTVDTALGSLYSYAKKHDSDGASVYLLQQVTNRLRPHE